MKSNTSAASQVPQKESTTSTNSRKGKKAKKKEELNDLKKELELVSFFYDTVCQNFDTDLLVLFY